MMFYILAVKFEAENCTIFTIITSHCIAHNLKQKCPKGINKCHLTLQDPPKSKPSSVSPVYQSHSQYLKSKSQCPNNMNQCHHDKRLQKPQQQRKCHINCKTKSPMGGMTKADCSSCRNHKFSVTIYFNSTYTGRQFKKCQFLCSGKQKNIQKKSGFVVLNIYARMLS